LLLATRKAPTIELLLDSLLLELDDEELLELDDGLGEKYGCKAAMTKREQAPRRTNNETVSPKVKHRVACRSQALATRIQSW